MSDSLRITRPDDWHLHVRDGDALSVSVPASARDFARALVMPNLVPPVTTVEEALGYRARIQAQVPAGVGFEPMMALYMTETLTLDEVARAAETPEVLSVKLYPAGATTNSDAGVRELDAVAPQLEAMQRHGLALCVHGESVDPAVDVFDREKVFIERSLAPLCERYPELRVVFEHITTSDAAQFVEGARAGVVATITPQHLLMNRNDLFVGGLRPHNYCLPVLKRREHQQALRAAAASGSPRFFLGTDSAPHARNAKQSACGCAGCYSAPAAMALYATVFEQLGALEHLEAFGAHHGADFYGLPRNTETIELRREPWTVPEGIDWIDGDAIVPYWAGQPLPWRHGA